MENNTNGFNVNLRKIFHKKKYPAENLTVIVSKDTTFTMYMKMKNM